MTAQSYQHAEAFALMHYQCKACRFLELIWNSRDGVTPYGISCRRCGAEAMHVSWQSDVCAPDFKPGPGQRVFRDGSPLEAEESVHRRVRAYRSHGHEVPDAAVEIMLREAREGDEMSEWAPGWPKLVEVER